MDNRIGTMSADEIKWPELTISGQVYDRKNGVSTITLDTTHFAVKDAYPSKNENELVLELVAILAPKASKVAPKEPSNG